MTTTRSESHQGCALAQVGGMAQDGYGVCGGNLSRAVARAIVHHDDMVRVGGKLCQDGADGVGFVVSRDDDRNHGRMSSLHFGFTIDRRGIKLHRNGLAQEIQTGMIIVRFDSMRQFQSEKP